LGFGRLAELRRARGLLPRGDRDLVRADHRLPGEFALDDIHGGGRPTFHREDDLTLVDRLAVVRHRARDVRVVLLVALLAADDDREEEKEEQSERTAQGKTGG